MGLLCCTSVFVSVPSLPYCTRLYSQWPILLVCVFCSCISPLNVDVYFIWCGLPFILFDCNICSALMLCLPVFSFFCVMCFWIDLCSVFVFR